MRRRWAAGVLACAAGTSALADRVTFDQEVVGGPPQGWLATLTGKGHSKWTVEQDETAPSKSKIVKQSGEATFALLLKEDARLKDGFVEVKFKAIAGKEHRAGGIVWRAKDANNYYVVRANALEDNVVPYKTVNGERHALGIIGGWPWDYGVKTLVAANQWHTLRVEFLGSRFKAIYDGKQLFEVEDTTFPDAGTIGLWTKADSVTLFDDFEYGASP